MVKCGLFKISKYIFVALGTMISSSAVWACDDPMSSTQLDTVNSKLSGMMKYEENTSTGRYHHKGTFKIDECRNITVKYGSDVTTEHITQLFTELNSSHHRSAYFGVVKNDEWSVSSSDGILVFHQENVPSKMAEWLIEMNRQTIELLQLAGYESDPSFSKREELLQHSFDTFGRPQFSDALRFRIELWKSTQSNDQ